MIDSGVNLVMTVIGFAVSVMFIVFVCTRLICTRIQLNNLRRRSFPVSSRSDLGLLERGFHGLEPMIVANFPTRKYDDGVFAASEDSHCTVCLAEYHGEDILRILPYCGHFFHVNCIDIWLHQHSTCPVCRVSLNELPVRKKKMQPLSSPASGSQYNMEMGNLHTYSCLMTGRALQSRAGDDLGTNSRQDGHHPPENHEAETEETLSSLAAKDKHVESSSNS